MSRRSATHRRSPGAPVPKEHPLTHLSAASQKLVAVQRDRLDGLLMWTCYMCKWLVLDTYIDMYLSVYMYV